jgi:hypothetical protein
MKIKMAIITLVLITLGTALSSMKAQTYPLGGQTAPRCPDSVVCSIDHQSMPRYNRSGMGGHYEHIFAGELHSVNVEGCENR